MICLNCSSSMSEEGSFFFCPNRACWKHLGFIFHIPKEPEHAKAGIDRLLEWWDKYEKESVAMHRGNLQRAAKKG